MNKLFDLRFVIGIFFSVTGVLLLGYYFISSRDVQENIAVNKWCGLAFTLFGIIMIVMSRRKIKE